MNARTNSGSERIDPRSIVLATVMLIALVSLVPAAEAELYPLVNIGDTDDRWVDAVAKTFRGAREGQQVETIDGRAARYFVRLPDATMDALAGSATRVGQKPSPSPADAVAQATMAADVAAGDAETGDTGWVEYRAAAASLMLFSPDGQDEESDIRFEPARVFLRRLADGSIYLMLTKQGGEPPPPDD